jgi:hypothetical protein
VQHGIADIVIASIDRSQIDRVTDDWSKGVRPSGCKSSSSPRSIAVETAWRLVDRAMDLSGGFRMFKKSGWMAVPRRACGTVPSGKFRLVPRTDRQAHARDQPTKARVGASGGCQSCCNSAVFRFSFRNGTSSE